MAETATQLIAVNGMVMHSNPSVSLCMIVKNEAALLADCLKSVQDLVDEMVIVDTGSEDQTVTIAESFGARVFHFPWGDDFSAARNESLRQAKGDWVLCLDADERLDSIGQQDCLRRAASVSDIMAYVVTIKNLKNSNAGAMPNFSSSIRMFANRPEIQFEGTIHERVDGSLTKMHAKVGRAGFVIVHEGYDADMSTLYGKLQRNVELLRKRLEQTPDNAFDLYYLGLSLSALGSTEESIAAFRRALSGTGMSPILHAMVLNQLAAYHFHKREYRHTIELAQKSLSLIQCQSSAPYLLGMTRYHREEPGAALPLLLDARHFLRRRSEGQPGDLGHEIAIDEAELAAAIDACHDRVESDRSGLPHAPHMRSFSGRPVSRLDLSVCMMVKNEAHQLGEALSQFQAFADEIVVVDTGSTDDTKSLASQFTPQIFDFPWGDDFSAARNFSIAHAHGRYVLWLDADDRFQPDMRERINRLKAYFDGNRAFYFLLENLNEARESLSCCYQLRCFPRHEDLRFSGRVHEQILPAVSKLGLDLVQTDIAVQHQGYMDQNLYREKMRRNLRLLQIEQADGRDHGGFHFFLALTHAALGNLADALTAMETAMDRIQCTGCDRWLLIEGYLFLATHYLEIGKRNAALRSVIRAEAYAAEEPRNQYRLGLLYQDLNRHNQAVACFMKACNGQTRPGFYPSGPPPASAEIMLYIAYSFFCLGQGEEALKIMQEAQSKGMGECEAWQRLAGRALATNRFDLALQAYTRARSMGELDADGYCNLGLLLCKRGSPDEAISCYQAALERKPHHRDCLANLAHLYLDRKETRRAKEMFEILVADGAREPDLLLGLAQSALKTGDWQRFQAMQHQLLQDPSLGTVAESLGAVPNSWHGSKLLFSNMVSMLRTQGREAIAKMAQTVADILNQQDLKEFSGMSK